MDAVFQGRDPATGRWHVTDLGAPGDTLLAKRRAVDPRTVEEVTLRNVRRRVK